jgi:hypothetical protein
MQEEDSVPTSDTTSPSFAGSPPRLDLDAVHAALRAARYATQAYSGPIGELISRELHDYVAAGYQLAPAALPPRLIAAIRRAVGSSEAIRAGRSHGQLPARYRPGSPLHWGHGPSRGSVADGAR